VTQSIKIMKNSIAILVGRLYNAVLGLIAVGLIARYLKVERFGDYAFILAVCTVFMVITDMGIYRISIREMSRDLDKANEIFWASSIVKILLSVITFLSIVLTINIMSNDKDVISATYICAIAVIVFFLGDQFFANYIAFERMGYTALSNFVEGTTYLLFVALFVRLDFGLNGIFWALLLSYIARVCLGIVVTHINFFKLRFSLNPSLSRYLVKEGFPIGVNRILKKASFRIDTILIKLMRSPAEVGIYHGPYRIILTLILIPQSITEALFPMISRLATKSKDSISLVLEKSFKLMLVIVIPFVIMMISFSDIAIRLVLGENFIKAIPVLKVFSIVWGIMFFNELFTNFLNASNRQFLATKAMAICLAVNILLDIILIYTFGYFGAVIATLLAEASFSLAGYYFVSKTVGLISWRRVLPKPLLAAVPMVIVIYLLNNAVNQIVSVSSGLIIFVLGLFIFKVFEPNEIAILKEILGKLRHRLSYLSAR
jgi:O-antigen/teichoic acid export membrane protein